MNFPHQPERDGQRIQPVQPIAGGFHIIRHLLVVVGRLVIDRLDLEENQLLEVSLRPLNPARRNGLSANERSNEQVRVRQHPPNPLQLAERLVGPRQERDTLLPQRQRPRQGIRHKGQEFS